MNEAPDDTPGTPSPQSDPDRTASPLARWGALLVFLAACAVYLNTLGNDFVWDDFHFVLGRPEIRSADGVLSTLTTGARGLYRPVREVAYGAMWQLAGTDPLGWHLFGLLLHGLATLAFYAVVAGLAGRRVAFFSALLFAVHSVHTQRVAGITGAMDLVGIALMTGAWALAVRGGIGRERLDWRWLAPSMVVAALAFFASEEAILLPAYLALTAVWRSTGKTARAVAGSAPVLAIVSALALAYLAARTFVLSGVARSGTYAVGTLAETMQTMGKVFLRYFQLLLVPTGLRTEYSIPPAASPLDPVVLAGWLAVAVVAACAFVLFRKRTAAGFGLAWMLLALAPFANVLPAPELIAERYLYVPSMGYCLAAESLFAASRSRLVGALFAVLVGSLALQTIAHNRVYADDCTLFADTLTKTPDSSYAHNNLGACLAERKQYEAAETHFRAAVRLDPANARARYNLALELRRKGDTRGATITLEPLLSAGAANDKALFLAGLIDGETGRKPVRVRITAQPAYQVGRGVAAEAAGRADEARWYYRRALESPDLSPVYRDRAARGLGSPSGEQAPNSQEEGEVP